MRGIVLGLIVLVSFAHAQTKPAPKAVSAPKPPPIPSPKETADLWAQGATRRYCKSIKDPKIAKECVDNDTKLIRGLVPMALAKCKSIKDAKKANYCVMNSLDDEAIKRHALIDQCGGYVAKDRNVKLFYQCLTHQNEIITGSKATPRSF